MAAVAAGALIVTLTGADVALTALHPTLRGVLSHMATRAAWVATRAVARATGRHRALSLAAPAAMIAQFLIWVAMLWIGFGLIYLPSVQSLSYSPSVPFGDRDVLEALYLSATALTTVGFGDVVAGSDALRLVTVLEAASGLAIITAAITYVLSVYPLVSEIRSAARVAASDPDDRRAAELVAHGGAAALTDLHARIVRVHQDTKRFPVLYYFHADEDESLLALLRGSVLVCAHLQWSIDRAAVPAARLYGPDLQRTIERIIEDYARRFLGPRRHAPQLDPLTPADAHRRLARLRAAMADVSPGQASDEPADIDRFARFVGRSDAFLAELARRHEYRHRPLLGA